MWVPPLGWEDPLEKGKATDLNILSWRIPWTEEPGAPQSKGSQESDMTEVTQYIPYTLNINAIEHNEASMPVI